MLDLTSSLDLRLDGQDVSATSVGRVVRAEIGSPVRLLRSLGTGCAGAMLLPRLAVALARYDTTLILTRGGRPLARLGSGVEAGFFGTLLRIPHFRLD